MLAFPVHDFLLSIIRFAWFVLLSFVDEKWEHGLGKKQAEKFNKLRQQIWQVLLEAEKQTTIV